MGMGFDSYQVFRGKIGFPRWLIFLCDLFFWLASVGMVFIVLVKVNDGIVRFPVYLAVIVGAWLYFLLGSKYYVQLLLAMIKFSQWLYRVVMRILDLLIVKPIGFVYRVIAMIIGFLFSIILMISRTIWKIVLFLLHPLLVVLRKMAKSMAIFSGKNWIRLKQRIRKWIKRE